MEHGVIEAHTIFGLDPTWAAASLFVITYVLIMLERVNRSIIALIAASLMILSGVLTQEAAIQGIDFNTIGLLTGMMIIVAITRDSGVFQFLAIWSAKRVGANPWGILVTLVLVTAVCSALLDNVTTVLLIVPVTLLITDELKLNPYPYMFSEIFASNIGGTATLIGDPPNIMIGTAVGLSFNDFVVNLGPAVAVILPITLIPIYVIWGRSLHTSHELRQRVMAYDESKAITNRVLLWKSMLVLGLVIVGFVFAHDLNLQPATIAMFGAALLILLDNLPRAFCDQAEACH